MVALSLSSCAVGIRNFTSCGLVPGNSGAECDDFLVKNPQSLTELQWEAMEASWNEQGLLVECTTSEAIADLKIEIEQLCSVASCSYETQARLRGFFLRLDSIESRVRAHVR